MDQEDDEDDSKRNLAVHLGIVSDSKREKAIQTYNDDIEEFEEVRFFAKIIDDLWKRSSPFKVSSCLIILFRFGYSNSLSVLSYLVRVEPYSSIFIDQNGKLDNPNRMISDVYEVIIAN